MMKKEIIAKFFGISVSGAYNYFKEANKRPIVRFVKQYLNEENIEEFLSDEKISKFEAMSSLRQEDGDILVLTSNLYEQIQTLETTNKLLRKENIILSRMMRREENTLIYLHDKGNSISSTTNTFGDRLQILRKQCKYTQTDFANFTDIGLRTYMRYENNERLPDVDFLQNLRKKTEVDLNWLICGQSTQDRDPMYNIQEVAQDDCFN